MAETWARCPAARGTGGGGECEDGSPGHRVRHGPRRPRRRSRRAVPRTCRNPPAPTRPTPAPPRKRPCPHRRHGCSAGRPPDPDGSPRKHRHQARSHADSPERPAQRHSDPPRPPAQRHASHPEHPAHPHASHPEHRPRPHPGPPEHPAPPHAAPPKNPPRPHASRTRLPQPSGSRTRDSSGPAQGRGRGGIPCSCTPRFLVPGPFPRTRVVLVVGRSRCGSHTRTRGPHPGAGQAAGVVPSCVRVTLRVVARRTGTGPRRRGICPERPPTLR